MSAVVVPFPRRPGPFLLVLRGRPIDAPTRYQRWYLAYGEDAANLDAFDIMSDRETLTGILDDARDWRRVEPVQLILNWVLQ